MFVSFIGNKPRRRDKEPKFRILVELITIEKELPPEEPEEEEEVMEPEEPVEERTSPVLLVLIILGIVLLVLALVAVVLVYLLNRKKKATLPVYALEEQT